MGLELGWCEGNLEHGQVRRVKRDVRDTECLASFYIG
jgi:hypothetical protein